jgi:hypothetical protein
MIRVAALALLLAGCATPERLVEVRVPVPVTCIEAVPERPDYPADALTGDEDLWTLVTTLWADRLARQAHQIRLEATLRACAG